MTPPKRSYPQETSLPQVEKTRTQSREKMSKFLHILSPAASLDKKISGGGSPNGSDYVSRSIAESRTEHNFAEYSSRLIAIKEKLASQRSNMDPHALEDGLGFESLNDLQKNERFAHAQRIRLGFLKPEAPKYQRAEVTSKQLEQHHAKKLKFITSQTNFGMDNPLKITSTSPKAVSYTHLTLPTIYSV
eukprot:TRINITY_DN20084_c0_g2_i2.p1 TRINITY_DN20084_c0_g2~~TRINITY_DN20084_c0_g2_i2.p1  ORF type:complete len:189 (-),score=32.65 TRINITY_DN20084_c0_g2_i2:33-599(-)